jgi:glycosyltransferase involved in cell wall biosynthesis
MIPTYKQADRIRSAVDSALAQDYKNLEVVVSDDASGDGTEELIAAYSDPRIRLFVNEKNLGRVANYRKTLYERAQGEWVLNLDGDDLLIDPCFISSCIDFASSHPGVVLIFGDIVEIGAADSVPHGSPGHGGGFELLNGTNFFFSIPKNRLRLQHLSALYRRSEALPLDFYSADIVSSDYDSFYRLILNHEIAHCDRVAGAWIKHESNFSSRKDASIWLRNLDLFDNARSYARIALNGRDNHSLSAWYRRNFIHYIQTLICRAIRINDGRILAQVLAGARERNRSLFILTLILPSTYLKALKTILSRRKVRRPAKLPMTQAGVKHL